PTEERSSFIPVESSRTTKYPQTTTEQIRSSTLAPEETTPSIEENISSSTQSVDHATTMLQTERSFATERSLLAPTESGRTTKYVDTTTEQFSMGTSGPKETTLSSGEKSSTTTQSVDHETTMSMRGIDDGITTVLSSQSTDGVTTQSTLEKEAPYTTQIIDLETTILAIQEVNTVPTESGRTIKYIDPISSTLSPKETTLATEKDISSTTQFIGRETTLLPTEREFSTEQSSFGPTEGKTTTKYVDSTTEQFKSSPILETTTVVSGEKTHTTESNVHETTLKPTAKGFSTEGGTFAPTESGETTKYFDTTTEQFTTSGSASKQTPLAGEGRMFTTTQYIDHESTILPTEKLSTTEHSTFVPAEGGTTAKYFDITTEQIKISTGIPPKATTLQREDKFPTTTQFVDHETTLPPTEKPSGTERSSFIPNDGKTTIKYIDTTTSTYIPKVTTFSGEEKISSTSQSVDHETTLSPTEKTFVTDRNTFIPIGRTPKYDETTTERLKTTTFAPQVTTMRGEEKLPTTMQFVGRETTLLSTKKSFSTERSTFAPTEGSRTTKYFDTTTEQIKTSTGIPPRATTLQREDKIPSTTQFVDHETTLPPTEKTFATERSSFSPTESGITTKYVETTTQELRTSSVPHK
ncbi:zonadhesin-like, partial [Sitodiplosis mosellana]|uniref:zonadhesin-like n=1 Tax=Sitodiplosis mosellana TaxID=263140 RepID=UPI002443A5D1